MWVFLAGVLDGHVGKRAEGDPDRPPLMLLIELEGLLAVGRHADNQTLVEAPPDAASETSGNRSMNCGMTRVTEMTP